MVCRLCLIESNDSIEIFTKENIQKYIYKFLQLELHRDDPVSKIICFLCWQQLENFQDFVVRVEEAQRVLNVAHGVLKEEVIDDAVETPTIQEVPFEHVTTNSSTNLLKEDDTRSHDGTFDTNESFPMDEKSVKFELHSESYIPPDINDSQTVEKNLADTKLKRKDGRPQTMKTEMQQTSEDESESDEQTFSPDVPKRKRGRPKKGDERAKVEKVSSEKREKMLETTKEIDDIIQKNMNLTCNICEVFLIDFAELKRHFRVVHNRKGYAVCCDKRLYSRGLAVDHINTHKNPDHFKCTDCGKVLADRMCLRNHVLLLHQNEDEKMYQCSYCPNKYAKQYLLAHHQVKHIPQEECTFKCTECGKGFPTKGTLTQHNQIHSTANDIMCEICAKIIRGNEAFERHMDEHEGIVRPQVQCEICGAWLKNKNSLRMHMYKHDGKSYSCDVCGKSAPSKSSLQSHLKYVHRTVRQFHCTYCNKSFKKDINLREHLTTHTGGVLYTCPHCPKTFNSKANMHAHRKKMHHEEWKANRRGNAKQETSTSNQIPY